jgi:hypothetical protein
MCFVGCIRDCREVRVEKDGIVMLMMMMTRRWELAETWLIRGLLFLIAVSELDNNQVFAMTSLNRRGNDSETVSGDVLRVCHSVLPNRG